MAETQTQILTQLLIVNAFVEALGEKRLPLLLDEKQASEYTGMSIPFLRRRRSVGELKNETPGPPCVKIDGTIRYPLKGLETWVEEISRTGRKRAPKRQLKRLKERENAA